MQFPLKVWNTYDENVFAIIAYPFYTLELLTVYTVSRVKHEQHRGTMVPKRTCTCYSHSKSLAHLKRNAWYASNTTSATKSAVYKGRHSFPHGLPFCDTLVLRGIHRSLHTRLRAKRNAQRELEMLLLPNALCWSSRKCNYACALPAEVQLRLRVTRWSWQKLFAGKNFVKKLVTTQTPLRSYSEQQRVFGNSNICNSAMACPTR